MVFVATEMGQIALTAAHARNFTIFEMVEEYLALREHLPRVVSELLKA